MDCRISGRVTGFALTMLMVLLVAGTLCVGQAQAAVAGADALQAGSVSVSANGGSGKTHADGWAQEGGAWHYWKNGKMLKNRWLSTKKAPAISGASEGWHRYWIDKSGDLAVRRLIDTATARDKAARYCAYATKYGYVATGKTVVGNKVYLAKNGTGKLATGGSDGWLTTSMFDGSKQTYYISKEAHAVLTGQRVRIPGFGSIYNIPKKGYVARGVTKVDSNHVVLADSDGRLCRQKTRWVGTTRFEGTGQRYWVERTDADKSLYGARTGLFKLHGKKYYADKRGCIFRNGIREINGKYYSADKRGALTKSMVAYRMIHRAQHYSSPSKYLIMVDTDDTKVIVFEGSRGDWKVKYIWNCVTGAPATPTVLGTFSVGAKGYSFGEEHGYSCYYWTQFHGNYLFHTRKYFAHTHTLEDGRMNKRGSMGCVRLMDEDAIWIWKNVPTGTTVVTMV